jgi:hypothetical protein
MIASFFQSLDASRVDYLLISGQAAVLYGAANFSEDIDLWVEPAPSNLDRFAEVLRQHKAAYYKLSPPLQSQFLETGHGIHFTILDENRVEVFLDIMGRPPRVRDFATAKAHATVLNSQWGPLRTISITDLIELKKTQRLEDYPVISNLVLCFFSVRSAPPTETEYVWALDNIFTLAALDEFFSKFPSSELPLNARLPRAVVNYGKSLLSGNPDVQAEEKAIRDMSARMAKLQNEDRLYWREVIRDLRRLKAGGLLMKQGTPI